MRLVKSQNANKQNHVNSFLQNYNTDCLCRSKAGSKSDYKTHPPILELSTCNIHVLTLHMHPLQLFLTLVFCLIRVHVGEQVKRAERQFLSLPKRHQNILPNVLSNLARIRQCADHNQEVLQAIIHNSLNMFENIEYGERVSVCFWCISCVHSGFLIYIFFSYFIFRISACCVFVPAPEGSTKGATIYNIWHGQAQINDKAVCQGLERGGPGWEGLLLPADHPRDTKSLPKWPIVGTCLLTMIS